MCSDASTNEYRDGDLQFLGLQNHHKYHVLRMLVVKADQKNYDGSRIEPV